MATSSLKRGRERADRALALAEVCCHRAEQDAGPLDSPAVRTAFRAVRLAVRLGQRGRGR
ncbi:hypothetical protein ACFQ0G_01015 [Streptomyces chiangmaiensis]